ncbi:HD domain-containing protein [Rhodococcus sp. ARC_M6]|uniref:HD domain-containing protein n=1 Tax=Rhodococcus sp. ARC_M6 TaxID=2928852 RepID=UPI001FB1D268|nr:HD domain-containing protein [Rhodococcus sp. ARC_M6]MCJ0904762.1 HD domain-containing protein [Rhodococcus sp. ARC_M6]
MSTSDPITSAFKDLTLKEMDAATLVFAIENAVDEMSIQSGTLRLAMEVATLAHLEQSRKNGIKADIDPYIVHPLRNVLRLIRYGCADADVLAATALHDTVEDQPQKLIPLLGGIPIVNEEPYEMRQHALTLIVERFGPRIAEIVAAVTNPINYGQDGNASGYRDHVVGAISDPSVFLVKFSDFVDNAGSVKYLAKAPRLKLVAKYEPLVEPFKEAARSFGSTLNLPQAGLDGISEHIATIESDFARLRAST